MNNGFAEIEIERLPPLQHSYSWGFFFNVIRIWGQLYKLNHKLLSRWTIDTNLQETKSNAHHGVMCTVHRYIEFYPMYYRTHPFCFLNKWLSATSCPHLRTKEEKLMLKVALGRSEVTRLAQFLDLLFYKKINYYLLYIISNII